MTQRSKAIVVAIRETTENIAYVARIAQLFCHTHELLASTPQGVEMWAAFCKQNADAQDYQDALDEPEEAAEDAKEAAEDAKEAVSS